MALPAFPDIHRLTGAGRNESFSEIVRGIVKLEKIETALAPFQRQLQELGSALPSPLNEHLNPTVEGFGAAIKIIELIGQLESTLISRRSEHFDEDDFDVTIKDLEVKLHHLRLLRETITDCFDLEKLPESRELRAIQAQMLRRGGDKWFSGSWWKARKQLKALASKPYLKVTELSAVIEEASEYAAGLEAFDSALYQRQIGPEFQGLETDVEGLKSLREWYRSVRSAYGIGFGKTVPVGDCILSLDAKLFKGIQQLEQKCFTGGLRKILAALDEIRAVIPNIDRELDRNNSLTGEQGSLLTEQKRLRAEVQIIQQWFKDSNLTVEEVESRVNRLKKLQTNQVQFFESNLLHDLFAPQATLLIGPCADDKEAVEAIRETLDFAGYVQRKLRFEPLRQVILSVKTHEEYERLKAESEDYLAAWRGQEESYEQFKSRTELNPAQWLANPEWNIEELLQRNLIAIQKPEWLNGWVNFVRIRNEMQVQGLEPLWRMVTSGKLDIESAGEALDLAVFDQLSREILCAATPFSRFWQGPGGDPRYLPGVRPKTEEIAASANCQCIGRAACSRRKCRRSEV